MDDGSVSPDEPHAYQSADLADDRDVIGLVRRYERSMVDIDQRLKDIVMLLSNMRADLHSERDRTDQLERDFAEHRGVVNELGRKRAARKK
jgi:hypothetical protein